MQYRTDPKSGERISALGLGCMRFPRGVLGAIDQEAAERIIARAAEQGVNYLDTAYLYPGNEACVGAALEHLGLRDWFLIATKLPHASCKKAADLDRYLDEQLKRLRTDRIDYYLMHNVTSPAQWERLVGLGIEAWIARQKERGRIRHVGFSYHGSAGDFTTLLDAYDWDFCQIQYNYANETYQAGTAGLKAAAGRGLAVFIMEPLLGGRLADKLPDRARRVLDGAEERVLASAAGSVPLDAPAAWGLAWVWDHPEVTMLLSGMASPAMVDDNAAIAQVALPGCLSAGQRAAIGRVREVFEQSNRVPCTGCNYCMPCPHGINIPGCFAAYNASYAHGWFTGVSQYFTASAIRSGHPRLASNCVRCGACARHCPQHIEIPDRLVDVRRRLTPGPVGAILSRIAGRADDTGSGRGAAACSGRGGASRGQGREC